MNINAKYAFAQAVNYFKNCKAINNEDWKKKARKIKLTNKDAPLVLRSFKRIEKDMVEEVRVLNSIPVYQKSVRCKIDTLYVDAGGEFMAEFAKYCDSKDIHIHVFRNEEFDGLKRRLRIVEHFNRTNNHRSVSDYFRRDYARGKIYRPRK